MKSRKKALTTKPPPTPPNRKLLLNAFNYLCHYDYTKYCNISDRLLRKYIT